jgi:Ca2+-transporting ATPase
LREHPLIAEIPFDALRKRMTTIHEVNGKTIAYVKGAPEVVLELCNRIYKGEKVKRLDPKGKEQILSTVKQFAAEALRVLAFAYREVTSTKFTSKEVEKNLIFVGLVGMIDPPREEVKEAIRVCKKAGIKAVMITGDHKLTAEAIAKQIGMLESGKVLTGTELDRMSDKDLEEVVEEVAVYARTSPHHKVRILEALKHKGHVVAMTGDGVNDAPAVKKADIGIAMGIKGTDVTKEASDMVLADDNFATIVNAVKEGRGIYDNIRKFVRFLLCVNFDEILLVTASVLARLPLPLLPIQILWINIVTDGPPALALGVDPYDPRIMERKPRHPKEGILHGMLSFVVVAGLFAFLTGLAVFLGGLWLIGDLDRVRSMVFTQTVMFELFFIFNCRSEEHSVFKIGVTGNRRLLLAIATSVCLQAAVLYIPFLQFYFGTVPLTFQEWTFILLLSTAGLFVLPEVFMR